MSLTAFQHTVLSAANWLKYLVAEIIWIQREILEYPVNSTRGANCRLEAQQCNVHSRRAEMA